MGVPQDPDPLAAYQHFAIHAGGVLPGDPVRFACFDHNRRVGDQLSGFVIRGGVGDERPDDGLRRDVNLRVTATRAAAYRNGYGHSLFLDIGGNAVEVNSHAGCGL
jgi:hypothetical protein